MYHEKRIPVDAIEFMVAEVKAGRATEEPAVDAAIEVLGVANRWRPGYDDEPVVGVDAAVSAIEAEKDTEGAFSVILPFAIQIALNILRNSTFGKFLNF
jgi:hypothetical protein